MTFAETYFAQHPVYKDMDNKLFGTKNLSIKLMKILRGRIEDNLPNLLAKVETRKNEVSIHSLFLSLFNNNAIK